MGFSFVQVYISLLTFHHPQHLPAWERLENCRRMNVREEKHWGDINFERQNVGCWALQELSQVTVVRKEGPWCLCIRPAHRRVSINRGIFPGVGACSGKEKQWQMRRKKSPSPSPGASLGMGREKSGHRRTTPTPHNCSLKSHSPWYFWGLSEESH